MKRTAWIGRVGLLAAIGLLASACQQEIMQVEKAQFHSQAGTALAQYTNRVSDSMAKAQGVTQNRGAVRGLYGVDSSLGQSYFGNWNPWGNQPYGGSIYTSQMDQQVQTCVQMVNSIPATSTQNFYLMVASLARCLDVVVSYRNPLMTFAYRNLDQSSQYYWTYLLNYRRPGTYSSYPASDATAWSNYSNGMYNYNGQ